MLWFFKTLTIFCIFIARVKTDDCTMLGCQNYGLCLPDLENGNWYCLCKPEFTGAFCETGITDLFYCLTLSVITFLVSW